jgi:AcrR family transcriptional regulator
MVEVASIHGYARASVSRVVESASVSKATFYEHFRDREDCFLAAYRTVLEEVERSNGRRRFESVEQGLASLLSWASSDPALARLLLIECYAGPPSVRSNHHQLLLDTERAAIDGSDCLRLPTGALQGGISAVVASALMNDDGADLESFLPALTVWLRCYEPASGVDPWDDWKWITLGQQFVASLPDPPITPTTTAGASRYPNRPRLPRGRSAASVAFSAEDRRRRLLYATAEVVALRGYPDTRVADIVAAAGVTRSAFYSHFASKLDAFVAVLKNSLRESVAHAAAQFFLEEEWPERVWAGLEAFLRYFGQYPDAAHLGTVEIYAAGKPALQQAEKNRSAFTLFLADGYRQNEWAAGLSDITSAAIAGAIEAVLRRQLLLGQGHRALELMPQCAYIALTPFIGCDSASKLVVAKSTGDHLAMQIA